MNQNILKLHSIIKNNNIKSLAIILNAKKYIYLKKYIIDNTSFLNSNTKMTERVYCVINKIEKKQLCLECGNEVKFNRFSSGYNDFCSRKCGGHSKIVHKRYKIALMDKYGSDISNISQLTFVKEIKKKKNQEKYGVDNIFQSKAFKLKQKQLLTDNRLNNFTKFINKIEKNFSHNITKSEFISKGYSGPYRLICNKCGNIVFHNTFKNYGLQYIVSCNICFHSGTSKCEKDIIKYIQYIINNTTNNIFIENDRKILNGKELDIYIPNKNLAIEYDGLMFHSVGNNKYSMFNNSKIETEIKNKHLWKTEECKKQGIQLLHIFENEWLDKNKQNIWKSIIKRKLGYKNVIYGRNTYIKLVSNEVSKEFLNMYHLQGNIPSKLKIGLFDKTSNELLSIMIFGKSRLNKNIEWNLLGIVNKGEISIKGGISKIFKYFLNNYVKSGEQIKVYSDLRFSNGDIYKRLGFKLINQTKPNYYYFKTGSLKLESKYKYQKYKLKDKIEKFDENLTESENMYNNNYRKIYDCGNLVFLYKK